MYGFTAVGAPAILRTSAGCIPWRTDASGLRAGGAAAGPADGPAPAPARTSMAPSRTTPATRRMIHLPPREGAAARRLICDAIRPVEGHAYAARATRAATARMRGFDCCPQVSARA